MPHGVPNTLDLVHALRTFLEDEVTPATDGRLAYLSRVAANVAATVERELVLEPDRRARHEVRLGRLGMSDDRELAAAVRRGDLDGRRGEVVELALADVLAKLGIWNPRYVEPEDAARVPDAAASRDDERGASA